MVWAASQTVLRASQFRLCAEPCPLQQAGTGVLSVLLCLCEIWLGRKLNGYQDGNWLRETEDGKRQGEDGCRRSGGAEGKGLPLWGCVPAMAPLLQQRGGTAAIRTKRLWHSTSHWADFLCLANLWRWHVVVIPQLAGRKVGSLHTRWVRLLVLLMGLKGQS